jgi:hypothetical protein
MSSNSGLKRFIKNEKREVRKEERHIEKHGILVLLILLGLLIVAYSFQNGREDILKSTNLTETMQR